MTPRVRIIFQGASIDEEEEKKLSLPEADLWVAVSFTNVSRSRLLRYKFQLSKRAAHSWLTSDNRETGSFLWICHQVDLSPSAVRRAALTRFPINECDAGSRRGSMSLMDWVAPSLAVMHPLTSRTHRPSRRRQRKISPPSHVTV